MIWKISPTNCNIKRWHAVYMQWTGSGHATDMQWTCSGNAADNFCHKFSFIIMIHFERSCSLIPYFAYNNVSHPIKKIICIWCVTKKYKLEERGQRSQSLKTAFEHFFTVAKHWNCEIMHLFISSMFSVNLGIFFCLDFIDQ